MVTLAIAAVVGYLLGSIPFGYILVRTFHKTDVREFGSGSTGATNVARSGGRSLGIWTLVLDALKGALAVEFAKLLNIEVNGLFTTVGGVVAVAAVAAIVGHCFPVWLKFKGGKGVATSLGIFLACGQSWKPTLLAFAVFAVVFALTRYVSLGSIVGEASFAAFAFLMLRPIPPAMMGALVLVPLIVILKHHENIRRLLSGTESRFRSPAAAA